MEYNPFPLIDDPTGYVREALAEAADRPYWRSATDTFARYVCGIWLSSAIDSVTDEQGAGMVIGALFEAENVALNLCWALDRGDKDTENLTDEFQAPLGWVIIRWDDAGFYDLTWYETESEAYAIFNDRKPAYTYDDDPDYEQDDA